MPKLTVFLNEPNDRATVMASGVKVLVEYRDSMVVQATDNQTNVLRQAGIELNEMSATPLIQLASVSFHLGDAVAAEAMSAPPAVAPQRRNYFLVRLVASAHPNWLEFLTANGITLLDTLPGNTLVVGMTAAAKERLQSQTWVETIVQYRPAMKVHQTLQAQGRAQLGVNELANLAVAAPAENQQVEVNVFPGEGTADAAAKIRALGGHVLNDKGTSVIAVLSPSALESVAALPGVCSILPHAFPKFSNDRAKTVMGIPQTHVFGLHTLFGQDQIIGIADSGIDTGNAATVHEDLRGRIESITSLAPNIPSDFFFVSNGGSIVQPWSVTPQNDGPADIGTGHGTHVAGSVLGNGTVGKAAAQLPGAVNVPLPAGAAPQARLFFQAVGIIVKWRTRQQLLALGVPSSQIPPPNRWPPDPETLFGLPQHLGDLFQPAYNAGVRIHTNSWGSAGSGSYTANSSEVDDFMWRHRDFLSLFSAGNEGVDEDGDGFIDLNSLGSPATAKNCLTVGACENDRPSTSQPPPGINRRWDELQGFSSLTAMGHVSDDPNGMAGFSSRGPVEASPGAIGRIKPDLVAAGTNILSTRTSAVPTSTALLWGELPVGHPLFGRYVWSGGTSMSTPLVAGAAALVREFLVRVRGHVQLGLKPSGALIKAILINGATRISGQASGEIPTGDGGNNVVGFGRVNVEESIRPHLQQSLFADEPADSVGGGEATRYRLTGITGGSPLKITLVWTDAPSLPGAGSLKNHLSLTVTQPNGAQLHGEANGAGSGSINNVQQVVIESPQVGDYVIRIFGEVVVVQPPWASTAPDGTSRQDFAVVASRGIGMAKL